MVKFRPVFIAILFGCCILLSACSNGPENTNKPDKVSVKRIALSFDDAPRGRGPMYSGDERAEVLIDTLAKAKSGPVVFFITTKGFANTGGKQRIERYAEAGHLIANHSHSHQWLQRMEPDTYMADIDRAERQLVGFKNHRPWFRFPYLNEGTPLEKRDTAKTFTHMAIEEAQIDAFMAKRKVFGVRPNE